HSDTPLSKRPGSSASAQLKLPGLHRSGERLPLVRCENQSWALRVLRIAHRHNFRHVARDFYAVAAVVAAVAGLAPHGTGQVHLSSATFMIRSCEALRGRVSDRSESKVSTTWATTADSSEICPPAALSR